MTIIEMESIPIIGKGDMWISGDEARKYKEKNEHHSRRDWDKLVAIFQVHEDAIFNERLLHNIKDPWT